MHSTSYNNKDILPCLKGFILGSSVLNRIISEDLLLPSFPLNHIIFTDFVCLH